MNSYQKLKKENKALEKEIRILKAIIEQYKKRYGHKR